MDCKSSKRTFKLLLITSVSKVRMFKNVNPKIKKPKLKNKILKHYENTARIYIRIYRYR